MKKKVTIALMLGLLILGTGTLLFIDNQEEVVTYDCDNLDVVYLKPSEKHLSGKIAREIKGIVVIPEENYLVADTEILFQCDDLDFSDYIKMENTI